MAQQQTIVIAGGCFWGLEELLRQQEGVLDTEVGYTGGENDHPTYRSHAGHAEVVQITFDPEKTNVETLLHLFFRMHDPTTRNRQGNDIGSSYRSAIFYASEEEKQIAQKVIDEVNASGKWPDPLVTTLEPLSTFWSAEEEHQDYLQKNPGGYTCHFMRS